MCQARGGCPEDGQGCRGGNKREGEKRTPESKCEGRKARSVGAEKMHGVKKGYDQWTEKSRWAHALSGGREQKASLERCEGGSESSAGS